MNDERSPAHRMAQALLDQTVRVGPGLWSPQLEQAYGTALDASGLPAAVAAAERYIEHLRNEGGHGACRRKTGPGTYECGYRLDWEAALREAGLAGL